MSGQVEYKIVGQRDAKFIGGFDLPALEQELNAHAAAGWRLAEGLVASSMWKSSRTDIVLVLERPAGGDTPTAQG